MLEIKATKDGSFDLAIDRLSLGYWTDSGKGSCLYFKNNVINIGWDKQIYFNIRLQIGRLRIKVDI